MVLAADLAPKEEPSPTLITAISTLARQSERHCEAVLSSIPIYTSNEFSVYELIPQVFYFHFKTQDSLGRTFLRPQEYFESPKFKGQIFSTEEFEVWYKTTTPDGTFTYYEQWTGFNFPSWVLDPFFDGRFRNISEREQAILDFLKEKRRPFYVVASFERPPQDRFKLLRVLRHEISHALYYFDPRYRSQVDAILAAAPQDQMKILYNYLIEVKGYNTSVVIDEEHAFLLTLWQQLFDKANISPKEVESTILKLLILYEDTLKSLLKK